MQINAEHEVRSSEFFATVAGVEYSIEARAPNPQEKGYWWVSVRQYVPPTETCVGWWKSLLSESCHDCANDLEAVRCAFQIQRSKMHQWLQSWLMYRRCAAEEKGGKRGYYTRHANEARKWALEFAPHWKLSKAIWKEITRL